MRNVKAVYRKIMERLRRGLVAHKVYQGRNP